MKRFIITGTGSCGTKYTSHLFKQLGIDLPHEALHRWNKQYELEFPPANQFICDCNYVLVPYIDQMKELYPDLVVFLQKRDRTKTIDALNRRGKNGMFHNGNLPYEALIKNFVEIGKETPVEDFYDRWNELGESKADLSYYIEDSDVPLIAEILSLIDVQRSQDEIENALSLISKSINTTKNANRKL